MILARRYALRAVNWPIGEALPADALRHSGGALAVIETGLYPLAVNLHAGLAVVVAEIKLRRIALEMLRRDMVERADDPALEDREIALDGVGMRVTADVFTARVVHGFVAGEHRSEDSVLAFAVRHETSL